MVIYLGNGWNLTQWKRQNKFFYGAGINIENFKYFTEKGSGEDGQPSSRQLPAIILQFTHNSLLVIKLWIFTFLGNFIYINCNILKYDYIFTNFLGLFSDCKTAEYACGKLKTASVIRNVLGKILFTSRSWDSNYLLALTLQ